MKIEFEDKSYIEATRSINENKIIVTIAAKDYKNSHSLIVNSVEITEEQWKNLAKL